MARQVKPVKTAFVHDWLVGYAGAERVLEQMLDVFPDADIYSVVDFLKEGGRGFIKDKPVETSFVQRLPFANKKYRSYIALMPLAVEQFDLSQYDVVISSSHAVAKGVITGPDQLHICMCYSPIRYAWDLQHQYLRESGLDGGLKGWIARILLHKIRVWDYRTAAGVDGFIAISEYIRRRIRKAYGRDSHVIYPPVDVKGFDFVEEKEPFYVTASRMVPYKKIDAIVDAFSLMPNRELVVIGDGPEWKKIQSKAKGNVKLLGYQNDEVLKEYMQRARAFIFAAEEDFGIVPVEAQACGTPVIAYGKGGALETVQGLDDDTPTGVFFYGQTAESIAQAVSRFEERANELDPRQCRRNAERFSEEVFQQEFRAYMDGMLEQFRGAQK